MKKYIFFIVLSLFTLSKIKAQDKKTLHLIHKIEKKIIKKNHFFNKWNSLGKISLDSVFVNRKKKIIQLFYNKTLPYIPIREDIVENAKKSIKNSLGWWYRKYQLELYSQNKNITEFIPNIYRKKIPVDSSRFLIQNKRINPIITRYYHLKPLNGLLDKNIAIWHSHGRYYESKLDRWEWQRARLHSTVEDMFPMTFVLDYLEPMLENAGATVFIPRERDTNTEEYIIDNDNQNSGFSIISENIDSTKIEIIQGFIWKDTLFNKENPFYMGKSLIITPKKNKVGKIKIYPDIKKNGNYAIYISYGKSNNKKVKYSICYSGGKADYIIDQTQGQGTWIYLGNYFLKKGQNNSACVIELSSINPFNWDAIKIGGGMGNVARRPSSEIVPKSWSLKGGKKSFQKNNKEIVDPDNFKWKTSGLPRYLEAARYYLQYSGMPDSIVYSLSDGKNDYNDDYQSRGEWVNYLMGNPNGPTSHRNTMGLGIPIDLSLAFHTDAGITNGDSIIGTLGIYSSDTPNEVFPSGQSKMTNRDLVDIIQTQIVHDIRLLDNPKWTRRGIWNKPYSEAWRANTPMMLLELLSHQNLADMSYGLDHRFKFDVARAIYKGILKYLAYQGNYKYVVQPLPVNHFAIEIISGKKIRLSWKPYTDPLEPTSKPDAFLIYMRKENQGFDQGVLVKDTVYQLELLEYNTVYSFKVAAVNTGGISFPGEILSVGIIKNNKPPALVVNAFDRVSGPAIIDLDSFSGIAYWQDMGVPYKREIGFTGIPYEYNRKVQWKDDDNPGWGASFADMEGKIISGNTFDYPFIHGSAIMNSGLSFVSVSDESFVNKKYNIKPYKFIDIILGEERTTRTLNKKQFTVFTPEMMDKIKEIVKNNGNIFISGAYIGTDFSENKDTLAEKFAAEYLHFKWRTDHATKSGVMKNTDYVKDYFSNLIQINNKHNEYIYQVESPDGIEPADKNSITAFRYQDNGISAGIIYNGSYKIVAFGFPFETIIQNKNKNSMMKQIIEFFN